jgi:hypothetical protein
MKRVQNKKIERKNKQIERTRDEVKEADRKKKK